MDRVSSIVTRCSIAVLSGDDSLTLPMMAVGAVGVISVASYIVPKELTDMTHFALEGNWKVAAKLLARSFEKPVICPR